MLLQQEKIDNLRSVAIQPAFVFIKNFIVLLFSNVISRLGTFFLFILCAKYLGVADFGNFSFINAATVILFIFVDFGINFYAVREVSRHKEDVGDFFANALGTKALFGVIGMGIIVAGCLIFSVSRSLFVAFLLAGISLFLDSVNKLYAAIFLAFEKAEYESIAVFIERSLILGLGFAALAAGLGLPGVFLAYALARLTSCAYLTSKYRRIIAAKGPGISLHKAKALIKESLPFALNLMLGVIAFRIDIFMLKMYESSKSVGIYSAAITLFAATSVVAEIFRKAIYPVMSRQFKDNRPQLQATVKKSVELLVVAGIPIAIACSFQAENIINLIYGANYGASAVVLKAIVLIIPFTYLNQILGITLTSIDQQNIRPVIAGMAIVSNVVLNAALIPLWGVLGAAAATMTTTVGLFFVFAYFVAKYFYRIRITRPVMHSVLAGATMVVFFLFLHQVGPVLLTSISLTVYVAVHVLTGSLKYMELPVQLNFSALYKGLAKR